MATPQLQQYLPSIQLLNQMERKQLLHKLSHGVKIGQTNRFEIEFSPFDTAEQYAAKPPTSLWLKVKNTEALPMRAAYLAGPYVLYVDCRSEDYSMDKKVFVTADQPLFEPQLLPGQSFYVELSCHTFKPKYKWTVDVTSQAIFNSTIATHFQFSIAESREALKEETTEAHPRPDLGVTIHDTLDLWNMPLPDTSRPIHLVILTHGLHLNVSADMLFVKEQIDKVEQENVVVKGFFNNVCKTERGIKYLGSRVAEFVVDLVTKNETFKGNVSKVSFIGHSLGGLVQTFAVAYLEANFPWFFQKITPINFVTMASPMIGVAHENPAYIKLALMAGVVGKTGQDLGLQYSEKDDKPLLLLLPTGPTHRILKRFKRRTVYANAVNDGIVPLRTSALLYLDYQGLCKVLGHEAELKTTGQIPYDIPGNVDTQLLPLLAMMSYFFPHKHKLRSELYNRFQTTTERQEGTFDMLALPKASMFETATLIIMPTLPDTKYINNPESRDDVIIHDKVYYSGELPPAKPRPRQSLSGMILRLTEKGEQFKKIVQGKDTEELEEEIARLYHRLMLWRKVLVRLKPDAHNNIIVRRRFANAYGWPVVDDLVKHHFAVDSEEDAPPDPSDSENSVDIAADDLTLRKILLKEENLKENETIDREVEEHDWLNIDADAESLFALGPTGILSDVSDRMWKLKEQWEKRPSTQPELEPELEPSQVMGDFV